MNTDNKVKVFLVDDDALHLKTLEIEFLQNADFDVETFSTGELCIENLGSNPDIIVLDYHLDGIVKGVMNGIETLDKIKNINPNIQVIMLSSQDKIDVAVSCMRHKAFDYVIKSETAFMRLKKIISTIFEQKKLQKELKWYMDRA